MVYFAKNISKEMCPTNKISEFEKIDMIINNILILYGFDAKLYNNLMIYIFIKAQPNLLNTNYKYIKIYLNPNLSKKYSLLLNKIEQLIMNLVIFDEKHLDGNGKR